MKTRALYAVVALFISAMRLNAQDTNTVELIRQLQQRIEELESKVRRLENPPPKATPNAATRDQRLEALDQKVRAIERNQELEAEAAEAKAKEAPKLSLGPKGFSLASANGDFVVQLKGVLQVDSRKFFDDGGVAGNDGFLVRRARPVLQGTVFRDFDFLFVPDFGTASNGGNGGTAPTPQIFDAYVNYRYSPALQFQAGKFKSPVGLEQLQADRDLLFNERALPTDLVPTRDIGFELHGDLWEGRASYGVGIFNGVGDARNSSLSDYEDDKAVAGRLFFEPFKKSELAALAGFGFGVGASYEEIQGTSIVALPNGNGYSTLGQQQFFVYTNRAVAAGDHWRVSPQGYYYYGPFGLLGEYVISDQRVSLSGAGNQPTAHLEHQAWQLAGSWLLTGEDATYGTVVPRRSFAPGSNGWGAWQLAARYSELDLDPDTFPTFADRASSARTAHEWSLGLNWFLNQNVRVGTSFSHTWFDGGGGSGASAPAVVTRKGENVLFTRVQLAF